MSARRDPHGDRRRHRGPSRFWLKLGISFVAGELTYYLLHACLGLSSDAAMLNGFVGGFATFVLLPLPRRTPQPTAAWPAAEIPQRGVPALPLPGAVPMPEVPARESRTPEPVAGRPDRRGAGSARSAMPPPPRVPRPGNAETKQPRPALAPEFEEMLDDAHHHIWELRANGAREESSRIRADVEAICATAEALIGRFRSADKPRLLYASRLESTLETTDEVVASYLDMESGRLFVDDAKRAKIRTAVEGEFLVIIAAALREFALRLDQGAVLDLEATIRSMTTRLKMEGL